MRHIAFALAVASLAASTIEADANTRSSRGSSNQSFVSEPPARGRTVSVPAVYAPGTIVIVNNERKLYYVTGAGKAVQYSVAVGKNSELWMGRTFITSKHVDPRWIPVDGSDPVEGGDPANPLGQRALYLDWSLLRIHGTPSRNSIGSAVSNGCIRMLNEDVVDLFERVHLGAPVYAIKSWKEASRFEGTKITEKIYADPEAHRLAQEALQETIAENARLRAENGSVPSSVIAQSNRSTSVASNSGSPFGSSGRTTYQSNNTYFPPVRISRPPTWSNPSALGRNAR